MAGRPEKPPSQKKKGGKFVVYVTEAERDLCIEAARRDGISVSKEGKPKMGPWLLALAKRRAAALEIGGLPISKQREKREALIDGIMELFHEVERDQRAEATAAANIAVADDGEDEDAED